MGVLNYKNYKSNTQRCSFDQNSSLKLLHLPSVVGGYPWPGGSSFQGDGTGTAVNCYHVLRVSRNEATAPADVRFTTMRLLRAFRPLFFLVSLFCVVIVVSAAVYVRLWFRCVSRISALFPLGPYKDTANERCYGACFYAF